jgi:hypothetical protein
MKTAKFTATDYDSIYGSTQWTNKAQGATITPMKGCLHMVTKHNTYALKTNPNQPNIYFAVIRDIAPELCVEFDSITGELSWYNN